MVMREETQVWGNNLRVAEWWNHEQGRWNIPSNFERRFPKISAQVRLIHLQHKEDVVTWNLSGDGKYSIDSYYEQYRYHQPKVNWDRLIWMKCIPTKFCFLSWLLVNRRLKTRKLLQRRCLTSILCVSCARKNAEEDVDRLFFACPFTRIVWQQILLWLGISRTPLS